MIILLFLIHNVPTANKSKEVGEGETPVQAIKQTSKTADDKVKQGQAKNDDDDFVDPNEEPEKKKVKKEPKSSKGKKGKGGAQKKTKN
jgi:hypothetical protein